MTAERSRSSSRNTATISVAAAQPLQGRHPAAVLLEAMVAALAIVRLFVPPEGSVLGRTLWITQGWLAAAMLAVWMHLRERSLPRRIDLLDSGVLLMAAAHVASALRIVILKDGDQRLAINMAWEWIGLAVGFVLLRHVMRQQGRRTTWQRMMVAAVVGSAALGLWQHYLAFPAQVREYQSLMREFDRLTGQAPAPPGEAPLDAETRQRRLREVQTLIVRQQIPLEGPARKMFEDRLIGSTEPNGFFALANTYAGWLAAWLMVGIGMLWSRARTPEARTDRRLFVAGALLLSIVAFCLVLTKSRTAWVGFLTGAVAAAVMARGNRDRPMSTRRKPAMVAFALVVFVAGMVGLAGFLGGLDKDVVAQAPKSLKYRLQYWTGSIAVLKERWFWGAGPGNFRSHYLRFKAPEASEEIADPHNFVLDLWTSGGILAVVGFAIFGWSVVRSSRRAPQDETSTARFEDGVWTIRGAWLGYFALLAALWGTGAETSEIGRLLGVAAVWEFALRILRNNGASGTEAVAGGIVALLVHLCGAGGIEMPAITQTLFVLAILRDSSPKECATVDPGRFPWQSAIAGGAVVALFIGCYFTATSPVHSREYEVALGDAQVSETGVFSSAERHYRNAALADPFSAEPIDRLAELSFARWRQRAASNDDDLFEQATKFAELAIALNPHNPNGYRRLGQFWRERSERRKSAEDARAACAWFSKAIDRYPHSARLRAEQADALHAAGLAEGAAEEARTALALDAINAREGHADKRLDAAQIARLEAIARR